MYAEQSLSENQRLALLDRLETEHERLRSALAQQLIASGDQRLEHLARRVLHEDREIADIVLPELNLAQYGSWIFKANELERALADFQMGDYGFCENCGVALQYRALQRNPALRYCPACRTSPGESQPAGATYWGIRSL